MSGLSIWVISDGRRGIENQALGLAEAIARLRHASIDCHVLRPSKAFKALPPSLQILMRSKPSDYGLSGALPHIAIGCGRQAIAPLRALKAVGGGGVFTTYIQDPREDCAHFDWVIAPAHDRLSAPNVNSIIGSPNRITPALLQAAKASFEPPLSKLSTPRAAMLIGGRSKTHDMSKESHLSHIEAAKALRREGFSLMISTSRRTPDWAAHGFAQLAKDDPQIWLYDGKTSNPYFAFLAAADMVLVTEDSTNMLTEACATGRPVYRLPMEGDPGKFEILYRALEARCGAVRFEASLLDSSQDIAPYPPLAQTDKAAADLLAQLKSSQAPQ